MPASLDDINKETIKNTNTLDAINKSIKEQTRILSTPPEKDVEGEREKKDANNKFLKELKGIIGAAVGGAGKAGKGAGKMLAKFLKFGLTAIMLPFLGLIGAIAGIFSGIMKTPEVKFLGGIMKTIGTGALKFVEFMGSIAKWMLNLIPGGKGGLGTKLFKVFGNLGKSMSKMVGGWGKSITGFLNQPKVAAVMGKVSKFIQPLARIAIWLFSAYEFIKGWGQADEIFGKEKGGATIVEKFASGIGGVLDFLTFGLIEIDVAAVALKDTFDFFKLAVTKPGEAWKLVTKWWEDFSFDETIVQPMLKMFENFPQMVRTFIDGPLSNFGSMAVTMLKDFVFGKKDPNAEEGDAKSGGLWGGIKSLFSAKNIAKAIKGFVKITAGFYKMLGSLVSIPLIGTKGNWTDLESWGGIFGWIKDDLFNWENIKGAVVSYFNIWGQIALWMKNIFWNDDGKSGLLQMFFGWIQDKFKSLKLPEFDLMEPIKALVRSIIGTVDWIPGIEKTALFKWANAKKPKETVAEKLAKDHPGKLTKADFMQTEEYKSQLRGDDGALRGVSKTEKDKMYQAYLDGKTVQDKKVIDDYIKPLHKGGGFVMDKNQTRSSSLTGQSSDAQAKMAILGSMFSDKVRITSGYRSADRSNKAMLGSKDDMTKYKAKWRDMLTEEQLKSKPGTKERQAAIDTMREGGFGSQHEHGNAIDFAYPKGFSKENFGDLKATLLGAFPGASIVGESDHVHMAFNKKNTGQQLAQMQIDAGTIGRTGSGGSGSTGGNSINNVTTNNSGTSMLAKNDIVDRSRDDVISSKT